MFCHVYQLLLYLCTHVNVDLECVVMVTWRVVINDVTCCHDDRTCCHDDVRCCHDDVTCCHDDVMCCRCDVMCCRCDVMVTSRVVIAHGSWWRGFRMYTFLICFFVLLIVHNIMLNDATIWCIVRIQPPACDIMFITWLDYVTNKCENVRSRDCCYVLWLAGVHILCILWDLI